MVIYSFRMSKGNKLNARTVLAPEGPMKEFIEYLIKHLVDKPEEIHVSEIAGQRTVVLELHVGDGDIGKVIGRGGQTARSIRTLLAASAAKKNKRYILEILDDKKGETNFQTMKKS